MHSGNCKRCTENKLVNVHVFDSKFYRPFRSCRRKSPKEMLSFLSRERASPKSKSPTPKVTSRLVTLTFEAKKQHSMINNEIIQSNVRYQKALSEANANIQTLLRERERMVLSISSREGLLNTAKVSLQ